MSHRKDRVTMPETRQRSVNLDLIRTVAILFVLSSHFLLRSAFYDEPVLGKRMFVMVAMRYPFMACVPLFLMLTGYLCGRKKPTKAYFRGLIGTLVLYVMAATVCLISQHFVSQTDFTVWEGVLKILNFEAYGYGWYVEMYIGLFFLCPFLNSMYHGLETRRQKALLVLVLIFITSAPSVFNTLNLDVSNLHDALFSGTYSQLVPDFWLALYPIQFYMIGMYLKEYGLALSLRRNLLYIVLATAFFSVYNFYRAGGEPFSFFYPWVGRSSAQNLLISVLIFVFCLHLPLDHAPAWLCAVLRKISRLSFLIYLLSSATDDFVYANLWVLVPNMTDRLNYFPIVVALSFLLSAIGAQLLLWLYQLGKRLCTAAVRKKQIPA